MRYLLKISYDGSKFYGFQRQKDKLTIQNEIEKYLSVFFGEKIFIKGAGRTDRGVHALGQYLHFDSLNKQSPLKLKKYLNRNLSNIKVLKVTFVSDNFHSRFSVKMKHYKYRISFSKKDFHSNYILYSKKLDLHKMKEASKCFLGVHNFQNFVSGERDNYECIIYKIRFVRFFNHLTIHFYGKSFYRYMVRNMVGALIDVGKGKATINDILDLLNSPKTDKMLSTAPAKGLTLVNIYYNNPKKL